VRARIREASLRGRRCALLSEPVPPKAENREVLTKQREMTGEHDDVELARARAESAL
jgi:hypothetical protein